MNSKWPKTTGSQEYKGFKFSADKWLEAATKLWRTLCSFLCCFPLAQVFSSEQCCSDSLFPGKYVSNQVTALKPFLPFQAPRGLPSGETRVPAVLPRNHMFRSCCSHNRETRYAPWRRSGVRVTNAAFCWRSGMLCKQIHFENSWFRSQMVKQCHQLTGVRNHRDCLCADRSGIQYCRYPTETTRSNA